MERRRAAPAVWALADGCARLIRARRTLALWGLALVLSASCSRDAGRPPDLYLLLIDTLRADHLSVYGYSRPTSRSLEQFAQEARVFTNVTAPSSWTLPSVGTLFTSRYPTVHGLRAHGTSAPETVRSLRSGVVTMAETLQQAGYYTAAVIANIWLRESNKTGANRGFMQYEVLPFAKADQVNARAQKILEEHPDRPVFLYLHYMEPHSPYDAPQLPPSVLGPVTGGERRLPDGQVTPARHMVKQAQWGEDEGRTLGEVVDAYDRTVYAWDQAFGRLLQWLRAHGRLDHSWTSIVADHGEEIFEHGGWGHGTALFQEQVKIPWILRGPGGKTTGRSAAPVSLIDVAPTMLAAAGVPLPKTMQGLDARQAPSQRLLFAEVDACRGDWRSCVQRAVWDGPLKVFVEQQNVQGFNLRDDPGERSPQAPDARLVKALNDWVRESEEAAQHLGSSQTEDIDQATRERLHALGY